MSDFATAAGHWYDPSGQPRYTITGKNGKERNTTLRDAREYGYVPSVTTIIRMAAAPALEKWKRDQVLMAALTLPRKDGEGEREWLARVEQDWQAAGRQAADRGTRIHAGVEKHYRGEPPDEEVWDWVKVARDALDTHCGPQEWSAERSFAHPMGYGGKTDLHSSEWVIDIKTKDGPLKSDLYDEHSMQLAAYRRGLGVDRARCGILFIDRATPAALFAPTDDDAMTGALAMFDALLAFWQAKTGYYPQRVAA